MAAGRHIKLQPVEIGLGHLAIGGTREQEGDVDVDALAQQRTNGRDAFLGGGHLDHDILTIHGFP